MVKIIAGKKYSTETAQFIGGDCYSNSRDFHYWNEELYLKKTGEFFLYGEGGPCSKYRETVGQNSWEGGWTIIPLTRDEAAAWAEKHLTAEEYIAVFGDVEE